MPGPVFRTYRRSLRNGLDARRSILPWQNAAAAATLGWWLAVALIFGGIWFALDGYHAVFRPLNSAWAPVPDWLAQCITTCGDSLFDLVLLLFAAQRFPQIVWLALPSGLIATVLSRSLKAAFDSMRPGAVLPPDAFHLTGPLYLTHSFPSGHTVAAFAVAANFAWFLQRAWMRWCAFAMALLVGLSRVGVGAHWPLDVVAGMGVGTLSVLLGLLLARRWQSWGLSAAAHFLLVALLAGCAVGLLLRQPEYRLALWWTRGIATLALALTAWDYLIAPAMHAVDRRAAVPLHRP
jgi:membrane-associated phospholipid phosphatase